MVSAGSMVNDIGTGAADTLVQVVVGEKLRGAVRGLGVNVRPRCHAWFL